MTPNELAAKNILEPVLTNVWIVGIPNPRSPKKTNIKYY